MKFPPPTQISTQQEKPRAAFTLIELLVLVAIIALLAGVLIPLLAQQKAKARRISCVGHLKNIGLSFRIYSTDSSGVFPTAPLVRTAPDLSSIKITDVFQSLSNELSTPKIIVCPADDRVEAKSFATLTTNNISYFVSLTGEETTPEVILGGDRNILVNGVPAARFVALGTNTPVSWSTATHNGQGNLVMSDGSVLQANSTRLKTIVSNQKIATNNLIFP